MILYYTNMMNDEDKTRQQLLKEVQELKQRLFHSENEKKLSVLISLGTIAAGIAHEIKNPLNFINNYAELCGEFIEECEQTIDQQNHRIDSASQECLTENFSHLKHSTQVIREHGKRIDHIIEKMLLHSAPEKRELKPTDLNYLLHEYAYLSYHGMRAQYFSFDADIDSHFDAGVGFIETNPHKLGHVFLNIFNNAFDALHKKQQVQGIGFIPKLSIVTKSIKGQIEIRIKDNGIGMPEEVVSQAFLPFYTTNSPGGGTGLGLSISHEIISREHGGKIKIETEEGKYTEFIITLPKMAN
ncbi:MAG: hypothetical protein HQM14_07365 [SAR324 cluster bacterium]|nr:hypothetical protein [SAR324 cluster bacterium]